MPLNIPESKFAIYQTPNSLKERSSVKWLDILFCRKEVKANFSVEDKKPDIDGTFEIITNFRFDGRLEVQIKTYNSKTSRNKSEYSCNSKLLFYALKNRLSCVLLFVVDSSKNKAYWKYLSSSYINSLNLKPNQKKVTVKFNDEEFVNNENFNSCLQKWHSFYNIKNNGIFFENCSVEESILNKNRINKFFRNIDFKDLKKEEIIQIQNFIDHFNHLLDNDYSFIKRFYYPEMWKMGIAIGNYSSRTLSYVLYPIFYGMNDFIIKKVKLKTFADVDYLNEDPFILATINDSQNPIINGSPDIILNHINKKIKDLIEGKKFLFLTHEICIEYIFDALNENRRSWKIEFQEKINLVDLKVHFESNYHSQLKNLLLQTHSRNKSNITTVYQCIIYLLNNDIKEINHLYPLKLKDDAMFIDSLFAKVKIIYTLLPSLFNSYIYYTFPTLVSEICFWKSHDLMAVNLNANQKEASLRISYFERVDEVSAPPETVFSINYEHELYDEYFKDEETINNPFISIYSFKNINYKLVLTEFDDLHRIKGRYSLHNQLYKVLGHHFDNFLKPHFRIRPDIY